MKGTILVEGPDDEEVVSHLLRPRGFERDSRVVIDADGRRIPQPLRHPKLGELLIKQQKGYPRVLIEFGVLLKRAPVEFGDFVAIIMDYDQRDPWAGLRARVVSRLPDLDETLPKALPATGLVETIGDGRRLGVWLMPDNQSSGMLETFLATLIPPSDRLFERAKDAVDGIPEKLFGPTKVEKAYLHTWLAWQAEPGVRMGTAISNKHFDPSAPMAKLFVDWLERLMSA